MNTAEIALSEVPEQFHELREVHVCPETLRHTHGVVVQPVDRELHAIRKATIQVPQESGCVGPEALTKAKQRIQELRLAVQVFKERKQRGEPWSATQSDSQTSESCHSL